MSDKTNEVDVNMELILQSNMLGGFQATSNCYPRVETGLVNIWKKISLSKHESRPGKGYSTSFSRLTLRCKEQSLLSVFTWERRW